MMAKMPPSSGGRQRHPTAPESTDLGLLRRARAGRRAFLALLLLLVLAGLSTRLGARTSTTSASGQGYRMTLTYPQVSRPGLAIRWILVIEHAGGFDKQLTVATTSTYFNLFDFNNLDPVPTDQTTHAAESIWVFDPPPGDSLRITMDGRLEPAQQAGKNAITELRIGGVTVAGINYRTAVVP